MSTHLTSTTDSTFTTDVLQSQTVTLVDFWAEWCGPCRQLTPILEEIAGSMGTRVKIVKLNVDENPQIATQFHIRGIPTMIVFKGGQEVDQLVGKHPRETIVQTLEKHL